MSLARKMSSGSKARSFVGYTGLEVVSDEDSTSGNYSHRNIDPDLLFDEREHGRMMEDVSTLYSVSMSDMQPSIDVSVQQNQFHCQCYFNKSCTSTLITFLMMMIGIILVPVLKEDSTPTKTVRIVCQVIRAAGLFGFTGGITNWISIKLIFTRISGFFCSGALMKHFVQIKGTVSTFILEAFFSPLQVRNYVRSKKDYFLDPENFDQTLLSIINSDSTSKLVDKKLDILMATPEGLMLRNLGVTKSKLKPMIMRYVTDMRNYASPLIIASLQSSDLTNSEKIREQIVDAIATRTQQISPGEVQNFVTLAFYKHLSWLVLWGNLFGAIIGCLIEIASIYTRGLPG